MLRRGLPCASSVHQYLKIHYVEYDVPSNLYKFNPVSCSPPVQALFSPQSQSNPLVILAWTAAESAGPRPQVPPSRVSWPALANPPRNLSHSPVSNIKVYISMPWAISRIPLIERERPKDRETEQLEKKGNAADYLKKRVPRIHSAIKRW